MPEIAKGRVIAATEGKHMTKAANVVDRLAEIDLRILMKLYDLRRAPAEVCFDDVSEFPLSNVDASEVKSRFYNLERSGWITGRVGEEAFADGMLDDTTVRRLHEAIPGTDGVIWLQRARETLANCDADARQPDQARQIRDGILGW